MKHCSDVYCVRQKRRLGGCGIKRDQGARGQSGPTGPSSEAESGPGIGAVPPDSLRNHISLAISHSPRILPYTGLQLKAYRRLLIRSNSQEPLPSSPATEASCWRHPKLRSSGLGRHHSMEMSKHDSSFFGLADIPGLAEQHFSLDGTPEPSPHSSARTERSCSRPALARAGSSGRSLLGNCWPWGQPTAHMASMVGHPSRAADYAVPGLELCTSSHTYLLDRERAYHARS